MRERDILKVVLDRMSHRDGMSNVFTADEVAIWPSGALESLKREGLLKKAEPASVLKCGGCEERCTMPVHIVRDEAKDSTRAFISCDKREDVGRVPVGLESLSQWRITGHSMALKLSDMLGFEQDPKEDRKAGSWKLGILKGKVNRPHVVLSLKDGAKLKIGSHEVELFDVLGFKKGILTLERDELVRIADRATKALPEPRTSARGRDPRTVAAEARHKSWQRQYRELKSKRPEMSDVAISRIIAKNIARDGGGLVSPETIRKNMKP